ncbi:MAG: small multi-drug export protein [Planctomycetota bacterium]|jgi:uncharacterized membrane protein
MDNDNWSDQMEQQEEKIKSTKSNQLKVTLFGSSEGRLFLTGIALALVYTFWLGIKILFSPEQSQILVGMTATGIIFGRAAGMAFGYSLGLGQKTVIPICMIIETVLVLVCYSLFVFSWRRLLVIKPLARMFERTNKAAETHKPKIQKYGVIGLFVFVWIPFWMTGPVVGSVIGFLLGLRTRVTITVVLSGTYVAILGWSFVLHQFHERVASYSSHAAMVLMVLLIIVMAAGNLLHRQNHDYKKKNHQ